MRRCLHENKRSHTFKSGECMWLCECGAGGGHYDQSVPSQGKLYRKGGSIEDPELSILDTEYEEPCESVAELSIPTFSSVAALDESEVQVPDLTQLEDGEVEDSQVEVVGE